MARGLDIAYIIGGSNTAIVGKTANTADIGITRNISCIIATGNCCTGITAFTGSISTITLDDCQSIIISQTVPSAIRFLRHVYFTDDAANIDSLRRQLRRICRSMNIATVASGFNMHRRTVQIARYTANITSNIIFLMCYFFSKATILFNAAGSHNIAAVVNSVQNAVILFIFIGCICGTKIAGNTAYVHRTADIAFYVIGIGNIAVLGTSDNTAYVACCIMVKAIRMIISIFSFRYQRGAYICFVGYILQLAVSTAAHNAADVGYTYLSLMSAGKGTVVIILPTAIICMINIAVNSKAVSLDSALVRGISNSCINGTADDAANIITTLNSIIVNNRILRTANSRIFCFTNQAADVRRIVGALIYTGNFTKIIRALVLGTVFIIC